MNIIEKVQDLIISNWETSVSGRSRDLLDVVDNTRENGKIPVVSRETVRQMDTGLNQFVMIEKVAKNTNPQSVGYNEERIEYQVTITAVGSRTKYGGDLVKGDTLLRGDIDDRWGGVTGEVKRIMKSVRAGYDVFEIVEADEENDISSNYGNQTYADEITVSFICMSNEIDTSV